MQSLGNANGKKQITDVTPTNTGDPQIHKSTNPQIHKSTNPQIHKSTNPQIHPTIEVRGNCQVPMNSRDLWLVLKAQDQTNRALNTFTRNVRNAGNQVAAANLQAQRAAQLSAIAQGRVNNEMIRAEIAQLAAQKATIGQAAAQLRLAGVHQSVIDSTKRQTNAIDEQIIRRRNQMAQNATGIAQAKQQLIHIDDNIRALKAQNQAIQDQEKGLAHLGGRMQSVAQTATAMGFAMSVAGVSVLFGMKNMIDTAIEYERQVRATATQVDGFAANLEDLAQVGRRLARDIAVPFETIQPALFDIFSSMEVSLPQAEHLLRAFSKAAVAGQVEIQDVSRATIGLLNAFNRPFTDVNRLLDIQFQLIQEGIGTYEEWNQRIGLVSPSAIRAGQSIEVMMAALASSTRFGISAARSGAAVARAFDALSHPRSVAALKTLGVSAVDAAGNFRPFNLVLGEFKAALDKLPQKGKAEQIEKILEVFKGAGGTIEARRFLQAVLLESGNLETFNTVLKEMAGSAGSLDKAYGLMANSAAAKTQMLQNQWMLLKEAAGRALTPAFVTVVTWLTNLIDKFNKLNPKIQKNVVIVLALTAIFLAIVGPILLVVGAITAFVAAMAVAGTAIAITLAILGGAIAIFAAAAAAIYLLWQRSSEFRDIIGEVGDVFKKLKEIISNLFNDIKGSWDEHLAKPMEKVLDIIETKFMPAFLKLSNLIKDTLMPKIQEAGRIIGDVIGKAMENIGNVIDNILIPALEKATEWWKRNEDDIKPFLKIMAQVVKWVMIVSAVVVGVLVVALIGPLVAAFLAVTAIIAGVVVAIVYLTKLFKLLWAGIKDIAGIIKNAFITAWDAVVIALTAAWEFIKNIVMTGLAFIRAMWEAQWAQWGGLVKATWDLIIALIKLSFAMVEAVFRGALKIITDAWHSGWTTMTTFLRALWDSIVFYWNLIWGKIGGTVTTGMDKVKSIMSSVWETVKSGVMTAWNSVSSNVSAGVTKVIDVLKGLKTKVIDNFKNGADWLFDAGKKIIQGIIDGMTSMINKVTEAINKVTKKIQDALPGSPVRAGPLRILNNGRAGKSIVQMLAKGIEDNAGLLDHAMNVGLSFSPRGVPGDFTQGANGGGTNVRNYNQIINVTTQEIDPRVHSAQLGWELSNAI